MYFLLAYAHTHTHTHTHTHMHYYNIDVEGCDSSNQLTCSNGTCIDRDRRCDRIKDCSDGGDERGCEEGKSGGVG